MRVHLLFFMIYLMLNKVVHIQKSLLSINKQNKMTWAWPYSGSNCVVKTQLNDVRMKKKKRYGISQSFEIGNLLLKFYDVQKKEIFHKKNPISSRQKCKHITHIFQLTVPKRDVSIS